MPDATDTTIAGADIPDDVFGIHLKEAADSHEVLMDETVGNIQSVHNIARHVGVKKYDKVDPLEAAASAVVLRIKPLTS